MGHSGPPRYSLYQRKKSSFTSVSIKGILTRWPWRVRIIAQNGLVYRYNWWITILHITSREFGILTDEYKQAIATQVRICLPFCNVPMHRFAICINKRACLFPTSTRSYLGTFQMEDVPRIPGWLIIFSSTVGDHDEILTTLTDEGSTFKINKCNFFQLQVEYLGQIVKLGCLEIDKTNVASLHDAQSPTNYTQLKTFLWLCSVYRIFIYDFAGLANPLNKLLKKGSPYSFTSDDGKNRSFDSLINDVCSPPILALPRSNLPY